MSAVEKLLLRLHGVKEVGRGCWRARCPAHDDRSPSLSLKETAEGAVLVHCFAGCTIVEITQAIGLDLADLYPPRAPGPGGGQARLRRPWDASDLLGTAAHEAGVIVIVTADILAGRPAERDRLLKAAGRLTEMVEVCRGR